MRRIIEAGLRFRALVGVVALGLIAFGLVQLARAPVDLYPEYEAPFVEIQTEALGLSAAEVEQMITVPLEADLLNGVAWLRDMRSESVPGMSSVTLVFEPGTDLYQARQMVQERLSQAAALPNVSKPPQMLQPVSSASRTMMLGLSSKTLSLIEISQLARWTIKPRLMGVDGVANVASFGQRERQLQVRVDPARLADSGVSLLDVVRTAGNALVVSPLSFLEASTPGTGGFIEGPNQRLGVRHISPIVSAGDLSQVAIERQFPVDDSPVGRRSGSAAPPPLRIGDVAEVVEDHQPLIGDALVNDGPGLILVVERLPGTSTVEVTRGVEAALDSLRPGLAGLQVDTSIYRPADLIRSTRSGLGVAVLVGLVLLLVVTGLAFRDLEAALVTLLSVLVSLVAALLVLRLRNAQLDLMVVAGVAMALGVVVGDAVTGMERVARRLAGSAAPPAVTVAEVAVEMRSALLYAGLVVLLPVVPLFFMGDLLGAFGRPLAVSYALAVGASTLVALLVTPGLALLLRPRLPSGSRKRRSFVAAGRRYEGLLARALATHRNLVVGVVLLAVAVPVAFAPLRRTSLARLQERDFLVELETPAGTSLPEMSRITAEVGRQLRALPGVRNVASHVGRAVTGDQVVGVNDSELWVSLHSEADYDSTVEAIRAVVAAIPGVVDRDVQTYQQARLKEAGSGADEPLVVRVYGQDLGVLTAKAEEVAAEVRKVDGVASLVVETPVQEPVLEVEVDLERARQAGVKPGDVRRAAAVLLSGVDVGQLFYDQKVFDVVVWGTPQTRENAEDVRNLLIDTPAGGRIRLADVASVREASSPDVIEREGAFRRIDVNVNMSGRDLGAVVADVSAVVGKVDFPLEYRAEVLGTRAEEQAAQGRLVAFAVLAGLGMVLLLQACFGNWRLGLAFFLALPVAALGGLLAAAAGDGLTVGAIAGLLTVLGTAVHGGVLLVRGVQQSAREPNSAFGADLVSRAARERLAPTLAAALATIAVLLPLAVMGDRSGFEILRPLAAVAVAGQVSALAFTLLLVPRLALGLGGIQSATELDVRRFEEELAGRQDGPAGEPPSREQVGAGAEA